MSRIIMLTIAIVGALLLYGWAEIYWLMAWLGLCLSFFLTLMKLHMSDALRLWGTVLTVVGAMLGGGIILVKRCGWLAFKIWIFICIILLVIFKKKILCLIPTLHIAQVFEEVTKEEAKDQPN